MNKRSLKSSYGNPILWSTLLLALTGWLMTENVSGQALFANLHSFTPQVNEDGNLPNGGLTLAGGTLYGTTASGGSTNGAGTVFAVGTNGTGYNVLFRFSAGQSIFVIGGGSNTIGTSVLTNFTGNDPNGDLVMSGNVLYGTTQGYPEDSGTVFAINTDGTGFTNIYTFSTVASGGGGGGIIPGGGGIILGGGGIGGGIGGGNNADGAYPKAGLILAGSTLYGTTSGGGVNGAGTVFKINLDGTGFTSLFSFAAVTIMPESSASGPNSTGAQPGSRLVLVDGNLYGTTTKGGANGHGMVFVISTNGTGFADLYDFTAGTPNALTWSGSLLYGTTMGGGPAGAGTVFALGLDGSGFTTLTNFDAANGLAPEGALALSSSNLFGVTYSDTFHSSGTVFVMNTNGTGLDTIYRFSATVQSSPFLPYYTNSDGAGPNGLTLSGSVIYGATASGGGGGAGTIFSLDPGNYRAHIFNYQPRLSLTAVGGQIALSWPTNDPTFSLQATTTPADGNSWSPVAGSPAVVGDHFVLTAPFSGSQMFYELMHP